MGFLLTGAGFGQESRSFRAVAAADPSGHRLRGSQLGDRPRVLRLYLGVQVVQRGLQGLLDHRVIERHLQQVADRQILLDAPGEQVAEVFGADADHLGAEHPAAGLVRVDADHALVLAHDQRAADRRHLHLADRGPVEIERGIRLADLDDIRIAEGDVQRRLAPVGADCHR